MATILARMQLRNGVGTTYTNYVANSELLANEATFLNDERSLAIANNTNSFKRFIAVSVPKTITTANSPYTVDWKQDELVVVYNSSGNVAVVLPNDAFVGYCVTLKHNGNTSGNTVTVTVNNNGYIDGATTRTINSQWESVTLILSHISSNVAYYYVV